MTSHDTTSERFLTADEAAATLRISRRTLQRRQAEGTGPRFARIGPRRLLYRLADVMAFQAQESQGVAAGSGNQAQSVQPEMSAAGAPA